MSTSANPNPGDVTPPPAPTAEAPASPAPVPPPPPAAPSNLPAAAPAPAPGYGYAPSGAEIPVFPNGKPRLDVQGNPVSEKSRLGAALLCWFLGVFGAHRFYTGKIGTAVLMIFTLGGLGIWTLIDFIMILVGSFKDKEDLPLVNW